MKIKRIVNIIFFVLSFFVIVKLVISYREISEANEYINHHLTKPMNIIFEVDGKDNSLSSIGYYPRKAEYYGIFNRLSKGYEEVANNPRVVDSDISYYLIAAKYGREYISVIGCDDIKEEDFLSYYSFREEDVVIGNNVVIIPQGMKNNEGQEIKIGDIIVINNSLNSYAVNCEVIGFHEIEDERFYMPNKAIEKISKKWLSFESNANYSENYSTLPVGISNPTFSCANEKDYAYLVELIHGFMEVTNVKYEIVRLDENVEELPNVEQMERETTFYWFILGIIFVVYIILIKTLHVNEIKREDEFEKSLIEQQEKYVSNLINTNQETHRLKHDMKHFLNHLRYSIEKGDIQDALKLLDEVQEDIYQVEAPIFTNSKSFNVVMNLYKERASVEGFDFNYSGVTNVRLNIQERKLFILLSNALDNAFTHNNQNKKVRIKIDDINGYYRIMILNTTDLLTLENNIKPFAGHGYGLKSMKQIVKEVHGDLDIYVEKGWFTCVILLPNNLFV